MSITGFCFSNEGGFLLLFFKKHKMSFCSLTYKKKEFTELIELTSHWCIVSSRFKSRCHFIVPEWALSIFLGSSLFYSGKRSARILFVHIGQMISVPLFFVTTSFSICFMSSPNYSMYSSYYSIGWQFEIPPIVSIRIVYDTSGNRTYIINLLPIWYFLNGAWRLYFISPSQP